MKTENEGLVMFDKKNEIFLWNETPECKNTRT